ncbi:hypothetical protein WJX82_000626 [Trebouxia sp. C0006]
MLRGEEEPRFLISAGLEAGAADRLTGIFSEFYMALLTRRAFLISTFSDVPGWDSVFDAPFINWTSADLDMDMMAPLRIPRRALQQAVGQMLAFSLTDFQVITHSSGFGRMSAWLGGYQHTIYGVEGGWGREAEHRICDALWKTAERRRKEVCQKVIRRAKPLHQAAFGQFACRVNSSSSGWQSAGQPPRQEVTGNVVGLETDLEDGVAESRAVQACTPLRRHGCPNSQNVLAQQLPCWNGGRKGTKNVLQPWSGIGYAKVLGFSPNTFCRELPDVCTQHGTGDLQGPKAPQQPE